MASNPPAQSGESPKSGRERRKTGRLRCSGLGCTLGDVSDLCASGMRVRSTKPITMRSGNGDVTLTTEDLSLTLTARIAWARQIGKKSYEAGLEFLDVTGEQRTTLAEIARMTSSAFAATYYTNAA